MQTVWDKVSGKGLPPRHWMGAWLTYRKFATVGYVPNAGVRQLMVGTYPYDYVFNYPAIPAAETLDARIVTSSDFYVLAWMATSNREGVASASSFKAQFYIDIGDGYTPSDRVLNQFTKFGTAQNPAWQRVPFFLPAQTPVLCRVQNLSLTLANTVQIVMYGTGRQ